MANTIRITDAVHLLESEIEVSYIRSPGPGGQNVNKVSSAAQLRFDLQASPTVPDPIKVHAKRLAGSRITKDGVIIITASGSRSQPQNYDEAVRRLVDLLRRAAILPKRRIPTRPTLGSKNRRLTSKTKRAMVKRGRTSGVILD